jgi:hypothetical protein
VNFRILCRRHPGEELPDAKQYRLRDPLPASAPVSLKYQKKHNPVLWMCDECAREVADWVEAV